MKYALKIIVGILFFCHLGFAQTLLRFQPHITANATELGDLLIIENNKKWCHLPLDSHPIPGEILTKTKILSWMTERIGPVNAIWQGKTQSRVQEITQSTRTQLVEKAHAALLKKLKPHYLQVEATPISHLKHSSFALNEFKVKVSASFPIRKRTCVWLYNEHVRIPVWFNVRAYQHVLVANRPIRYNVPIKPDFFSLKKRNIAGLNAKPALNIPKHVWLKSSLNQNAILLEHLFKTPWLVTQDQHIKVTSIYHGISITIDAIALKNGNLGEIIPVKNPLSQKNFSAKIIGVKHALQTV